MNKSDKMTQLILDKIKKFIKCVDEYGVTEDEFKNSIQKYFKDKYDVGIRVYVWGNKFGIDRNLHIAYGNMGNPCETEYEIRTREFVFGIDVLYRFCKDFECEFLYTSCDGDRYVFKFKDIDISKVFIPS